MKVSKRIVVGAALAVLLLVVPLGASSAAEDGGVVSGVVLLDGQPVAGAEVFLGIAGSALHVCTDSDGAFEFTDVPFDSPLFSATGQGTQLDRCANDKFLDPAADDRPLVVQFFDHRDSGVDEFQISAADPVKSDVDFDVVRLPNVIPQLTADAVGALSSCYDSHRPIQATAQIQAFLDEVNARETGGELDGATAARMRAFGNNLVFVFGTDACRGTFIDDDSSVFETDIEWMAAEGITKGCNPSEGNTRFCPDSVVTRGQMAAFLVRALGLTERLDDPFTDDDGHVFEADIERLAAAGITKGCNPPTNDRFCPDGRVSREQMAAFLVRALGYTDPGAGDLFVDDDLSIFEGDIDRMATAGVTKGCNPPTNDRYCPSGNVTRGQMAAFLHRALS
jgi:hypothetical protein